MQNNSTNAPKTMQDLLAVMVALRTPVTGCPWDLEQTFKSIAPYTIEEAYEVADAIARGDLADLKDELGDLLLQVVYHARIAEEASAFNFAAVVDAITRKMIRRHPHVFGDAYVRSADDVKGLWDRIKAAERAARKSQNDAGTPRPAASLLDNVPFGLPALTRAVKLQSTAAKVGFDWPSLSPVFEKLEEELREFTEVALPVDPRGAAPASDPTQRARAEEELGDLLFVMANIARHLDIDPESALRGANTKFTRRFAHIEHRLAEQGSSPAGSTLEEMDALWDEAKVKEKS